MFNLKKHILAHKTPYGAGLAAVVLIALFFGLKAVGINQMTGSIIAPKACSITAKGMGTVKVQTEASAAYIIRPLNKATQAQVSGVGSAQYNLKSGAYLIQFNPIPTAPAGIAPAKKIIPFKSQFKSIVPAPAKMMAQTALPNNKFKMPAAPVPYKSAAPVAPAPAIQSAPAAPAPVNSKIIVPPALVQPTAPIAPITVQPVAPVAPAYKTPAPLKFNLCDGQTITILGDYQKGLAYILFTPTSGSAGGGGGKTAPTTTSGSTGGGTNIPTTTPVCGNGIVEGIEQCDGAVFGSFDCLGNSIRTCDSSCHLVCSQSSQSQMGTISVNELGAMGGKITIYNSNSAPVGTASGSYPAGTYSIAVEPPAGFSVSTVASRDGSASGAWTELIRPDYKQTLTAGGNINFWVNYLSNNIAGGLLVNFTPAQLIGAGFDVFKIDEAGKQTLQGSYNSSWSIGSLALGTYKVVFKNVDNYTTPPEQTVTIPDPTPPTPASDPLNIKINVEYKPVPVAAGTLSIYSAVNPAGGDVTAGSPMVLVSKYRFHAFNEPFKISQLTIANDVEGIINAPVNADAVLGVAIKYKDINGTSQYIPYDPARPEIKYIPLNNGKAELIDLDIPVPKDLDAYLEIYAFIDSMANNSTIAGKTFRIGLMEPSISSFKAVGEDSTANPPSPVIEYTPADGSSVKTFTVVGPAQP